MSSSEASKRKNAIAWIISIVGVGLEIAIATMDRWWPE